MRQSSTILAHLKLEVYNYSLIGFVEFFDDKIIIWLFPGLLKIPGLDWAQDFVQKIENINKDIRDGYDLLDDEGWGRPIKASIKEGQVFMPKSSYDALSHTIWLFSEGRVGLEKLDVLHLQDS